ncbi:MAG TPA: IS110 family transposase [Acidimicrobiales bacterium]|nr:IS110 family transposase [Acidimicrobiales bacterium]
MSNANPAFSKTTWVGLDVHRDSITSAVLSPGRETPAVDRWFHDEPGVRRFVSGLGSPARVRLCYEAGPTGYDLARLLGRLGVATEVIAPSLIPVAPDAKVKTDARDARRLVHLYRSGELTAVHIPTPAEEAIRDLARTRADLVTDRTRSRHRLSKFLLRHGQVYRGGVAWTCAHEDWIRQVHFDDAALTQTFSHYRAVVAGLDAHVAAVESDLKTYLGQGPFADAVARLSAYRGVTELGALTLSAEVCDWRRFPRATSPMGFCGLVPSEYSSGERTKRGRITKSGNIHLRTQSVESAWSYQYRPAVGPTIKKRQQRCGVDTVTRAWADQLHLCGTFRRLAERKSSRKVVVTAIARELTGFLWAEMAA